MGSPTSMFMTRRRAPREGSAAATPGDADGPSFDPVISGDGRYVAFVSEASNLTRRSARRTAQVYMHDLSTGLIEPISRTPNGRPGNGRSLRPAIRVMDPRIALQSLARSPPCGQVPSQPAGYQSAVGRIRSRSVHAADLPREQMKMKSGWRTAERHRSTAPGVCCLITASRRRRGYGLR